MYHIQQDHRKGNPLWLPFFGLPSIGEIEPYHNRHGTWLRAGNRGLPLRRPYRNNGSPLFRRQPAFASFAALGQDIGGAVVIAHQMVVYP